MDSRWYIRIHYCPLLFPRDASRNRWHHTEVAVSCVITWLPPNHRKSKQHRISFAIQPLWKVFACLRQHMCGAQDLSWLPILHPKYKWYSFFTIAEMAFLLLANDTSPQMKKKLSALLTQLRGIINLTLLGSLCGIYEAEVNGCGVHYGLMQYDAIFWNLSMYFIFSRYIYLPQSSLRTQATGKVKSQAEADFYR